MKSLFLSKILPKREHHIITSDLESQSANCIIRSKVYTFNRVKSHVVSFRKYLFSPGVGTRFHHIDSALHQSLFVRTQSKVISSLEISILGCNLRL